MNVSAHGLHNRRQTPGPVARTIQWVAALLILTVLSGCGNNNEPDWHAKDISGLMPDLAFELIDTEGRTVSADDYRDQVRLMFFGFTNCPDVCPTTLAELGKAVRSLPEAQRNDVTILFVSVDPHRDTPEKIGGYTEFFGERITGLTAAEPALRELAKDYRTTFGYGDRDDRGNYEVSHSSAVYVFDRQGRARLLMKPELSSQQIAEDLARLVDQAT